MTLILKQNIMKKLFLFSLLFAFVLNMNGQEKKGEKSKTTTQKSTKSKKEAETKDKKAKSTTEKSTKSKKNHKQKFL
jgi:hypothetical protein